MDWVIGIITGILSGVIASLIISLVLFLIKPDLKISDSICREELGSDIIYKIKIVNKSGFMLTNLHYSLFYRKSDGYDVVEVNKIPPLKSELDFINKFCKKGNTDYAVRLTFKYDEISFPLNDKNASLEFVVFAQHSLSNSGKCFKKIFKFRNIEQGKFETGKSTKVIK